MPSAEQSQRPWRLAGNTIWDAGGGVVVSAFNPCDRATRRLIVDAVNERDRLAILVGRLADNLERFHIVGERDRALLREARSVLKRKGKRP